MKEIFQDDLLNAAANSTSDLVRFLHIPDKDWEKLYTTIVDKLNEILKNPEYRNYN